MGLCVCFDFDLHCLGVNNILRGAVELSVGGLFLLRRRLFVRWLSMWFCLVFIPGTYDRRTL